MPPLRDKWNDARLTSINAGVTLPATDIVVVHRADGSGTSFVFTDYLAKVSPEWLQKVGKGTSVNWPVGLGGRGNEGVSATVSQTPGAIGYVEYAFAVSSKMAMAELENKAGKFVAPSLEASKKALGAVKLPEDMRAWVTDPEGDDAYPIVTYTWILAKKKYDDAAKGAALKKLLAWCLGDGQKLSEELHYVPLPEPVAQQVSQAVNTIQ